jgi:hypothetical protein
MLTVSVNRTTMGKLALVLGVVLLGAACGGGGGACVGTGGVLSSPECKNGWSQSECQDWQNSGVNGATWTFDSGSSCVDLGYTAQCSDGSYRLPGKC